MGAASTFRPTIFRPTISRPTRRTLVLGALCLAGLLSSLQLGRWLAQAQQPLSRHAVGQRLLQQQRSEQASYVFERRPWQAVALYRAGRYQRAAALFAEDDSDDGLYNAANAFAHLGRYDAAIGLLELVLQRQPAHADARFNLDLIRAAARRAEELDRQRRSGDQSGAGQDSLLDIERDALSTAAQDSTQVIKDDAATKNDSDAASSDAEADTDGNSAGGGGRGDRAEHDEPATPGETRDGAAGGTPSEQPQITSPNDRPASSPNDDDGPTRQLSDRPPPATRSDLTLREQSLADDILLRRIVDDAAVVLRARLRSALRARQTRPRSPDG